MMQVTVKGIEQGPLGRAFHGTADEVYGAVTKKGVSVLGEIVEVPEGSLPPAFEHACCDVDGGEANPFPGMVQVWIEERQRLRVACPREAHRDVAVPDSVGHALSIKRLPALRALLQYCPDVVHGIPPIGKDHAPHNSRQRKRVGHCRARYSSCRL